MAIFNNNEKGVSKPKQYTQGGAQGQIFGGSVQQSITDSNENGTVPSTVSVLDDGTLIEESVHTINITDGLTVSDDDGTVDIAVDTSEIATRNYVDQHSVTQISEGTGILINDDNQISVDTSEIAERSYVSDSIAAVELDDLNNVSISDPQNGQSLVYNSTSNVWENGHDTGPVVPVDPNQSKISISASPSSVTLAETGTITVNLTLSLTSGYTVVASDVDVTDPNRDPISVIGSSLTTFSFTASQTMKGHFSVTASMIVTKDGGDGTHFTDRTALNIPVNAHYYSLTSSTQPSAVSAMTDEGVLDHNQTTRITYTASGGSDKAYFAVPTGTYTFHNGLTFAGTLDLGTISSDWTLYEFTDFDDSQDNATFTLSITED